MDTQKANPAVWFEIYVQQMERAQKFYETVLNVKLEELPLPETEDDNLLQMMFFPSNMVGFGCSGALVKMDGFTSTGNNTIIYFHSKNCSIEEKKIEPAGGKIFKPKMTIGKYGAIVLATDTEGNMFGIHSME